MMNKSNVNVMTGVIAAVLFVLSMMVLSTAEATAHGWSKNYEATKAECESKANSPACNNPILKRGPNHNWNNPNHGNDNGSIGGCSDNGKWCWNIQIGNPNHYPTFPVEYYGNRARNLIAEGRIEYANMNHRGVLFLGVYSRYHNRYFDCEVNVPRRQYHCITAQ